MDRPGPSAGLSAAEYYLKFISRFPSIVKKTVPPYIVIQVIIVSCILTVWIKTPEQVWFSDSESCWTDGRARKFGSKVARERLETVVEPTVEVYLGFLTMDGLVLFPSWAQTLCHKVTLEFIALCLLDIFSTCEPSTCFKTKNNKSNPKCKNQTDAIIL